MTISRQGDHNRKLLGPLCLLSDFGGKQNLTPFSIPKAKMNLLIAPGIAGDRTRKVDIAHRCLRRTMPLHLYCLWLG